MSKRKECAQIIVCDVCEKTVSDKGQTYYGGHPFSGFITVTEHDFSTSTQNLERKKTFDFCGEPCLRKFYEIGTV